jgi:hypothetical protein
LNGLSPARPVWSTRELAGGLTGGGAGGFAEEALADGFGAATATGGVTLRALEGGAVATVAEGAGERTAAEDKEGKEADGGGASIAAVGNGGDGALAEIGDPAWAWLCEEGPWSPPALEITFTAARAPAKRHAPPTLTAIHFPRDLSSETERTDPSMVGMTARSSP